jgi:cytochrome oxidase Cu insertion factor (SCO1/SenC/PrrC family)
MLLVAFCAAYGSYKLFQQYEITKQHNGMIPQPKVDLAKKMNEADPARTYFDLIDTDGQNFCSEQLRGKVWVLCFFYSTCTKECLELNKTIAKLQQDLPYHDVEFVSVTCNPELDTPQVLKDYISKFSADRTRWHVLTGDFDYIKKYVVKSLPLTYERSNHSDRLVIMRKNGMYGNIIESVLTPAGYEKTISEIKRLREESPDAPAFAPPKPMDDDE